MEVRKYNKLKTIPTAGFCERRKPRLQRWLYCSGR